MVTPGLSWLGERVGRGPTRVLAVAALVAAALATGIPRLGMDNSFAALFREGDPSLEVYRRFQRTFGEDDFLAVLLEAPGGVFSAEAQASLFRLHEALEAHPEVERVRSIPGLMRALDPEAEPPRAPRDLEDAALAFGRSPLFVGDLVSEDHEVAALYALVRPGPPALRESLVDAARAVELAADQRLHLAGPVAINHELDAGAQSDGRRFLPLALAAASATLVLWHGAAGLRPVAAALLGCLGFLGLLGWRGQTLNMVTVALPPLLFTLNLAAALHLFHAGGSAPGAGRRLLDAVGRPVLWCALTTAGGFLGLATCQVRPVREMGLLGAAGLLFGLGVVMPLVAGWCERSPVAPGRRVHAGVGAGLNRALAAARRAPRALLAGALLLGLAAGSQVLQLGSSLSARSFLRPDGVVSEGIDFGEAHLAGFSPAELMVEAEPGTFLDPANLRRLDAAVALLEDRAGRVRATGFADLLRHMEMMRVSYDGLDRDAYRLPEDRETVEQRLDAFPASLSAELGQLVSDDRGSTRVQLRLPTAGGTHFSDVLAAWRPVLDRLAAETGWRVSVTGLVPLLVRVQEYLVEGFWESLGVSVLVILVPLAWVTRSARDAALGFLPNILPVLVVLAGLHLAGLSLDSGTTMVASLGLGIAVDDTLHLLWGLVRRRRPPYAVMLEVGPALVWTSAAGAAGFGVLAFASFPPLARFGAMVAATLVLALLADIFLIPLLIGDREG